MTKHLMIDTETMGTSPDAAIVSIGAVFFDEHTGTIGDTFYRSIHLATSVRLGFKMEPATVLFWLSQPDAARKELLYNSVTVEDALVDFVDWVQERASKDELRVYANSPSFDCVKLQAHLEALDLPVPWLYFNERDYRTIRERNKVVPEAKREGLHNALHDAIHQTQHLIDIRRFHANKSR